MLCACILLPAFLVPFLSLCAVAFISIDSLGPPAISVEKFARVTRVALQNGKGPLGFLNPWLYQIGPSTSNAFNDVTFGTYEGCATDGVSAIKGYVLLSHS